MLRHINNNSLEYSADKPVSRLANKTAIALKEIQILCMLVITYVSVVVFYSGLVLEAGVLRTFNYRFNLF